tara:strand:- start:193 stop:360 length:168 start_codon:yes stop_codon:yes gene_type:complete
MPNNRTEQQQVDVFEDISTEDTKDNIVTEEEKEKEREERERLEDNMKLANDPVDW